ncbi:MULTISPECIES: GNAT family N-acetyltransferase [unclassified Nonomuraea]|uniref:GNAT family N-acetyltransferase n=1 Tax=unclassified Nonomuraea TaxID=2593643 RepID=UPI0033C4278F
MNVVIPPLNAVWEALTGPHAHLAERNGNAARYQSDVAPFASLSPTTDGRAWADLAKLVGPGATVPLAGVPQPPPGGWGISSTAVGVQLVGAAVAGRPDPEAGPLGPDDVPAMLDLVARTRPGPFRERTIAMGLYLGIRHEGRLIAMAGQRVRVPGWTEISAICTDVSHRGRGLATRLVLAMVDDIHRRNELPFLNVVTTNTGALRLYESLGFTQARRLDLMVVTPPVSRSAAPPPRRPAGPPGH